MSPGQTGEHLLRLLAREDDGHLLGPAGPLELAKLGQLELEHLAIEEEQRVQGYILGRGRDLALEGQVSEVGADLLGAHLARVALAVEEDKAPDRANIRLLGSVAQM